MIEYHWTEKLRGNLSNNLHPDMLTAKGYRSPFVGRVKGMLTHDEQIPMWLKFDRTYVYAYIQKKIINALGITTKQELIDVVSQAWDTI